MFNPKDDGFQIVEQFIPDLSSDTHTQIRVNGLNPKQVDYFKRQLDEGYELDPPVIIQKGCHNIIVDGWHRIEAYRQKGVRSFKAWRRDGGKKEAYLLAWDINITDHLSLDDGDKKAGIIMCLGLYRGEFLMEGNKPLEVKVNFAEVARKFKVDRSYVSKINKEMVTESPSAQNPDGEGNTARPRQTKLNNSPKTVCDYIDTLDKLPKSDVLIQSFDGLSDGQAKRYLQVKRFEDDDLWEGVSSGSMSLTAAIKKYNDETIDLESILPSESPSVYTPDTTDYSDPEVQFKITLNNLRRDLKAATASLSQLRLYLRDDDTTNWVKDYIYELLNTQTLETPTRKAINVNVFLSDLDFFASVLLSKPEPIEFPVQTLKSANIIEVLTNV